MGGFDLAKARRLFDKTESAEISVPKTLRWEIACIASVIGESFVTDLICSMRGKINNPRRYAEAALRKTCEEKGFVLNELIELVPEFPSKKPVPTQSATT